MNKHIILQWSGRQYLGQMLITPDRTFWLKSDGLSDGEAKDMFDAAETVREETLMSDAEIESFLRNAVVKRIVRAFSIKVRFLE